MAADRAWYGSFLLHPCNETPVPWTSQVPGLAQVDWVRVVDALYEGGYTGLLSVEHEDPGRGGSGDRVKIGLDIAQRTLRPLLAA
jgi:sugar phosphate isomerase/epimerase